MALARTYFRKALSLNYEPVRNKYLNANGLMCLRLLCKDAKLPHRPVISLSPLKCIELPCRNLLCESKVSSFLTISKQIHSCDTLKEQEHFRQSESSSYEGSGKTTVTILNEDVTYILIDSFSLSGFRLNTGLKAYGPMVVFPNAVLSWRVMDILEVNERSLSLFTIIEPKPEIVIVGYGDRPAPEVRSARLGYDLKEEDREKVEEKAIKDTERKQKVAKHIAKLTLTMKQKKLNIEFLPTEDAIATYNYLVSEDRLVAAALIPPNVVKMGSEESTLNAQLDYGKDPWEVTRSEMFGTAGKTTMGEWDWNKNKK